MTVVSWIDMKLLFAFIICNLDEVNIQTSVCINELNSMTATFFKQDEAHIFISF